MRWSQVWAYHHVDLTDRVNPTTLRRPYLSCQVLRTATLVYCRSENDALRRPQMDILQPGHHGPGRKAPSDRRFQRKCWSDGMIPNQSNQKIPNHCGTRANKSVAALVQRWIVTLHMAALAGQVVLSILLLLGVPGTLQGHSTNAWTVLALGLLQSVSVVSSWPSGSRLWRLSAGVVALAEIVQIQLGRAVSVPEHVTLGTVLWGLSFGLLVQVWAPDWGHPTSGADSCGNRRVTL